MLPSLSAIQFHTGRLSAGATETLTFSDVKGSLARMSSTQRFAARPILANGFNTATIVAAGKTGNKTSQDLTMKIEGPSSMSFTFDADGNTTNAAISTYPKYQWDVEGRLLQIDYDSSGNNHTDFVYDAFSRCVRMSVTASGSTKVQQFIWDGAERAESRNDSGELTDGRQFFAMGQRNFSGTTPSNLFYEFDHLGSIVGQTDAFSAESCSTSFDAYGIPTILSGSDASSFGFAGMYNLSGLNLTLFRQYDPGKGRWLSRDPIGENGGLNLYGYARNNPISNVDPLGLDPKKVILYGKIQIYRGSNLGNRAGAILLGDAKKIGTNCHGYAFNTGGWLEDPWDLMQLTPSLGPNDAKRFGDVMVIGEDLNGNGLLDSREEVRHSVLLKDQQMGQSKFGFTEIGDHSLTDPDVIRTYGKGKPVIQFYRPNVPVNPYNLPIGPTVPIGTPGLDANKGFGYKK